ncbi:hypothetical protein A1Q2_00291 [Trichosporon asahii var. asahii CBS 8904]|uniref:Uncharacterized protein n=1 Tax=Trichosporon asahii var. asahii (strain CBS 8904) TaxID=1220162 RepID=K1VMV4_TRIAC|nr:hypothetical protein A1Q2_00291 [Trichosporon asahii var. asahii CBS 8904]
MVVRADPSCPFEFSATLASSPCNPPSPALHSPGLFSRNLVLERQRAAARPPVRLRSHLRVLLPCTRRRTRVYATIPSLDVNMRSRSTTPSSSDVSADFSVVSPPTDPVNPLATAMEQVNLDNSPPSASDEDSFEIVVMPVSPASEQSESSLFSVLSIPTSVDSDRGRDSSSDSASDDLLSDSASGRSQGSAPVSSERPAAEDAPPKESTHLHTTRSIPASPSVDVASLPTPPSLLQPPKSYQVGSTAPYSTAMTLSGRGADTAADPMSGLTMNQRKSRRKAAAKAAAHLVLLGKQPPDEATAGFTDAQRVQFNRILQEVTTAANDWALKLCSIISPAEQSTLSKKKLKARRKAAVDAAVKAVQAGQRTSVHATIGFTEAQNRAFDQAVSKQQGKNRRQAEVQAAVKAVTAGWQTQNEATCRLTADQKTNFKQALEAQAKHNRAVVDPSLLSKQQRRRRRDAAVKAATRAVLVGEMNPEEAAIGFNHFQMLQLRDHLLQATKPASTWSSIMARGGTLSVNQCTKLTHARRRNADPTGSDDDRTESESGYSTDTSSTMSSQDAASAIYADTDSFTSQQENKLRLWQALCIEFGLVEAGDLADLPSQRTHRSSAPSPPSQRPPPSTFSDSDESTTPSRSVTPTQANPFPTSLTQAKNLLSTAHVNLSTYMALRKSNPNPEPGEYADLLEPSASALRKLLRESRQFAKLSDVKAEWLNPLLKDFGFARSRARSA